jgi:hypothetical protein
MKIDEILSKIEIGDLQEVEGVDPAQSQITIYGNYLSIDGLVPLQISLISRTIDREEDLEVKDEQGISIATLCFSAGSEISDFSKLTRWRFAAYLSEVSSDDFDGGHHVMAHDYLVVNIDELRRYLEEYADGAPIWGGFSHNSATVHYWTQKSRSIQARANLKVPTKHHKEALQRYLLSTNNFDRFLKLYHSVELLFDYVIFKKLQSLKDDLVGYGDVMKENSRLERERLLSLMKEFCADHDAVGRAMAEANGHRAVCEEMFQGYSKDGNPLEKSDLFAKFWTLIEGAGVSEANLKAAKIGNPSQRDFILKVAAYWIYRVRCSIAHNRVGEFILSDTHEPFIGEFCIPLLLSVVRQIFSDQDFIALQT